MSALGRLRHLDLDAELLLKKRLVVRNFFGTRIEDPGAYIHTLHAVDRKRIRVSGE